MRQAKDPKQSDIEVLLPAYVLGALEPDEMNEVDIYIRQQRDFLSRLQKHEDRSALLTHISKPVTPPPNVRRTIMMIARLDAPAESMPNALSSEMTTSIQPYGTNGKQNGYGSNGSNGYAFSPNINGQNIIGQNINGQKINGQNGNGAVNYAITPYRPQETAPARRAKPITIQSIRQPRLTFRLWQAAAVTALFALVAVGTIGLLLSRQLNWALEQTNVSQSKIETLMTVNNQLLVDKEVLLSQNQTLTNEQQQLTQQTTSAQRQLNIIADVDQVTRLRNVNNSAQPQATVYKTSTGFAIAANLLPELPPDRTYQLWLIDLFGATRPIAVFTVLPNEVTLWREFELRGTQLNYNQIVLSEEQIGGSASPSTIVMQSDR